MFINLDRKDKPVLFVTPGRAKETPVKFKEFLSQHGGSPLFTAITWRIKEKLRWLRKAETSPCHPLAAVAHHQFPAPRQRIPQPDPGPQSRARRALATFKSHTSRLLKL